MENGEIKDNDMLFDDEMYKEEQRFIAERITELRLKVNISESKLSYELGHNKNYIRSITVKGAMPSLRGLFGICDYFGLTPSEFFDKGITPAMAKALEHMKKLDSYDMQLLTDIINRLCKEN